MTAVPTLAFPDLDASQLDDKMDVASSPYRQADDIDIDLDSVRDPSVLGSVHDEMFDDTLVPTGAATDLQDRLDDTFDDDLMFDDTRQDPVEQHDIDYNMEGHEEEIEGNEDEDILYEDEEDTPPLPYQNNETTEYSNNQPQQDPEQFDVEALSAGQDHNSLPEEKDKQITNDTESLQAAEATGDQAYNSLDQPHYPQDQSLEVNEYPPGQNEAQTLQDREIENEEDVVEYSVQSEQPEASQHSSERTPDNEQSYPEQTTLEATELLATGENGTLAQPQQDPSVESNDVDDAVKTVHPVTLYYLEDQMSLFPPMLEDASSVYFLSDSSLAFGPLDQLLAACRDVLADTLDHHDELVLDVPGLGLHICEDSKYAAQMTLSQILDVYLHLCHNDEGRGVQPLYCHLSSRVSLATQYAYLASAGEEGKTYVEIAADHMDSPDLESGAEAFDQAEGQRDGYPENPSAVDLAHEHPPTNQVPEDGQTETVDAEDPGQGDMAAAGSHEITSLPTAASPAGAADHVETGAEIGISRQFDQEDTEPAADEEALHDQTSALESADPTLNQGFEVAEAAIDNADDDSNSSHTLEGDVAGANLETNVADDGEADEAEIYQANEQVEDFLQADESTLDLQHEYEPIRDEELFVAEDDEVEAEAEQQGETENVGTENASSTFADDSEHGLPSVGELPSQETQQSSSKTNAPISGNLSPPLTPKGAKRKVEDDDELLFLDLDTPDAKRRRPS